MGAFSLLGIQALIVTSPPVFYPPRHRDCSSSYSDSLANTSQNAESPGRPKLHPSASLSNLLPSASADDVSGEWEPLHWRASIRETKTSETGRGTPSRPSHRRSQSALPPGLASRRPGPSPMGRLQEFSRNPLASVSAISLPTLAELEAHEPDPSPSIPPSPVVRPRYRQSSRIAVISEPDSPNLPISATSSVPPPQHASMPPLSRPRPPASPRSGSTLVIPVRDRIQSHSRRPSLGSTSSVSDVAVLATWSFPASPEKTMTTASQPSERLRDRLRSLSSLDTATSTSHPTATTNSTSTPTSTSTLTNPPKESPRRPNLPTLTHRHTHSPTPLQLQFPNPPPSHSFLPPPRPQRRPTASRLRQPNPLTMPHDSLSLGIGIGVGTLSSSPGSMISDDASSVSVLCPSPTNSVESLPQIQGSVGTSVSGGGEGKGWLGLGKWRRRALDVSSHSKYGEGRMEAGRMESVLTVDEGEDAVDVERDDEAYIDFDEI